MLGRLGRLGSPTQGGWVDPFGPSVGQLDLIIVNSTTNTGYESGVYGSYVTGNPISGVTVTKSAYSTVDSNHHITCSANFDGSNDIQIRPGAKHVWMERTGFGTYVSDWTRSNTTTGDWSFDLAIIISLFGGVFNCTYHELV